MRASLLVPAVVLLLASAGAGSANGRLDTFTATEERALKPDCAPAGFDDPRIREFETGVCLFHKPGRSDEQAGAALDALRQAQVKGLPPAHHNFASLLSGIMNCRAAEADLARWKASNRQSKMDNTRFCRNRRVSAADLNDIRWDQAFFDYEDSQEPGFSLNARIEEMSACHATVLAPSLDAECGLISNVSEDEINGFVDAGAGAAITKYFTGAESPITAMFARKVSRAEGLKASASAGISALRAEAGEVNAIYSAMNAAYLAARDSKIAPTFDAYRDAILRANTILDEFSRWKGGLFIDAENVNLLPKLAERGTEIGEELARVRRLGFAEKSTALAQRVSRVIDAQGQTKATVAQLCRIFFCELANRRAMETTIRACRRPALAANPLCITPAEALAGGVLTVDFEGPKTADVRELCAAAGLSESETVVGMGQAEAASCLGKLP
ncbi:MAG TPA: hypothetical protein VGN97_00615 [Mesorhizobium sp.]|jgi:hypothetical protein|nr:hypothetical protein [Mesorhizobium sp.]